MNIFVPDDEPESSVQQRMRQLAETGILIFDGD